MASLMAQLEKSPSQYRRPGIDPWIGKMPWRREQLLTPVFCPGESHERRNLAGCSPWGTTNWTRLRDFHFLSHLNRSFGRSDWKESTCNPGHLCPIPGLGRSPGGGPGHSLQYSCLENPMDRAAWGAKGQTRLSMYARFNHLKHTFTATSKLVFDQTSRHKSPAKRTREIPITGLKPDCTL